MQTGLFVPNVGPFGDPGVLLEIAGRAERSGWDGFFVWDMLTPSLAPDGPPHAVDPWVVLGAVAATTTRIRLGPMVTPVARRGLGKLARETVTLDRLSGGRLIFGAGLGDHADEEIAAFGGDPDARTRAEKLDEGLAALVELWSGEPTTFAGQHFEVRDTTFLPRPVQQPRIPVWIAGQWPNRRPIRRAARWDGMFPTGDPPMTPADYDGLLSLVREQRPDRTEWDLAHAAPPGSAAGGADAFAPYASRGVTWWLEMFDPADGAEVALERAERGPLS